MLLETAIDPACLSMERSLELFRRILWSHGVVLLAIPQKWEKRAKGECGLLGHANRAVKIIETLKFNDKFVERSSVDLCSHAKSWVDCAADHHRDLPIGLVVMPHENAEHVAEPFKTLDAAIDEHPCRILAAGAAKAIPLERSAFVSVVSPLIRYSRQVYFCDPYVVSKQRRVDSLVEAMRFGIQRRAFADPPEVTIFIGPGSNEEVWISQDKPLPKEEKRLRNILDSTESKIREKMGAEKANFTLVCVDSTLPDGQRFHNRFVLTERFGIHFGESIPFPDPNQALASKDVFSFLSRGSLTEMFYSFHNARQEVEENRVRQFSL